MNIRCSSHWKSPTDHSARVMEAIENTDDGSSTSNLVFGVVERGDPGDDPDKHGGGLNRTERLPAQRLRL